METSKTNSDLVQRLKELNLLISSHIQKAKNDLKALESSLAHKRLSAAQPLAPKIPGMQKLACEWQAHLN